MQYRKMGKLDRAVSALGLGVMRMPMRDGKQGYTGIDSGQTDETRAIEIIREAIDRGVNYIDTAFNYLGGDSERIVGRALQDGLRDKTILATKAPTWLYKSPDDFDRYLKMQLERLQTDHIDVYLLHGMSRPLWEKTVLRNDVLNALTRAKKDGRIRYAAFSFHDEFAVFEEILNAYNWDVCQIQLNYLDTEFQAGLKGLRLAHEKGVGVSVMEPLRGGYLTRLPDDALAPFYAYAPDRTPAEWALKFLWDLPEVGVVLSGMGDLRQLEENTASADAYGNQRLADDERAVYDQVRKILRSYPVAPCTGCAYCNVCPKRIAIPQVFLAYNELQTNRDFAAAKQYYDTQVTFFGAKADRCIACHACEERCPQHIPIAEWMPKISALFAQTA